MSFNAYHKWLGIPLAEQPPSYYRLLGIVPTEQNADVISASADQRMNYLNQFTRGEHAAEAQKLMDEIARASMCLLDPRQRKAYDATLRAKSQFHSAPTVIVSRPQPEVAVGARDGSDHKPQNQDRSVLYFWVLNVALFIAVIVLTVVIVLKRGRPDNGNASDDESLAAVDDEADAVPETPVALTGPNANSAERDADDNQRPETGNADQDTRSSGFGNVSGNASNTSGGSSRPTPNTRSESPLPESPSFQTPGNSDPQMEQLESHQRAPAVVVDPIPSSSQPPGLTLPSDPLTVQQIQADWADFVGSSIEYENIVEMPLVLIPPGEYEMGGWTGNDRIAQTQHVRITQPFYISRHEVMQIEWRRVMGDAEQPSYYSFRGEGSAAVVGIGTNRFPVESVSWFEAIQFCNALSQMEFLEEYYEFEYEVETDGPVVIGVKTTGGAGYRLPTEAEWEFACKAGSVTAFDFGDLDAAEPDRMNSLLTGVSRTCEVESYQPNTFGIYDMHGNVWEWCYDWFDQFSSPVESALVDPLGPEVRTNFGRMIRGGSYISEHNRCTSISRGSAEPSEARSDIGFRVVRTLITP